MLNSILTNEPFTEREAFAYLKRTCQRAKLTTSNRKLGAIWQWSEASVRRFLNKLKENNCIAVAVTKTGSIISILPTDASISPIKNSSVNACYTSDFSDLEEIAVTANDSAGDAMSDSNKDALSVKTTTQDAIKQVESLGSIATTSQKLTQPGSQKEEKKEKNQKKEREEKEKQKEKNTPYRGLKKEKQKEAESVFLSVAKGTDEDIRIEPDNSTDTANLDRSSKTDREKPSSEAVALTSARKTNQQLSYQEVEIEHIIDWAMEQLIEQEVNLEWELAKFKDYWLSTRKKPPKDGVAAFRNWIRKAVELQQTRKGNQNDRNSYQHARNDTKPKSALDNFLHGAAELAARYERNRLDRNNSNPAKKGNSPDSQRVRIIPRADD